MSGIRQTLSPIMNLIHKDWLPQWTNNMSILNSHKNLRPPNKNLRKKRFQEIRNQSQLVLSWLIHIPNLSTITSTTKKPSWLKICHLRKRRKLKFSQLKPKKIVLAILSEAKPKSLDLPTSTIALSLNSISSKEVYTLKIRTVEFN